MENKPVGIDCFTKGKCKITALNDKVGFGKRDKFTHVDDCPNWQSEQICVLTSIANCPAPQWQYEK
jgi:hypothetical protein